MKTYIGTVLLLGLLGVACTKTVVEETVPIDPVQSKSSTDPTSAKSGGTAASVAPIDRISIYQGVEVNVVDDAQVKRLSAPIINAREALIRVHGALADGQPKQKLTAKLHLVSGGKETVLVDGPHTLLDYADGDLGSTFNFQLDATQVTTDMEFSVELVNAVNQTIDKFPLTDQKLAPVPTDAPKLRVQLVPVKYESDGSDRMPDMSDATLKAYHDALYQLYPVSDIELTTHATLDWPIEVDPMGEGWDKLLQAVMDLRANDPNVDEDVYYVGVFEPMDTVDDYCAGGCVLGVAPFPNDPSVFDTDISYRTALVTGYQTDKSGSTLAQELAHAMARLHAPCGNPQAIDTSYPYDNAALGTSGWDVLGKQLMDQSDYFDFMSYCFPAWVSDYTYKAIADRMAKVYALKNSQTQSLSTIARAPVSVPLLDHDRIGWMIQRPNL